MIHIILATYTTTCMGLTLFSILGAKFLSMTGLTALSITLTPELICGLLSIVISAGIASLLGIRLKALSRENGHISLNATSPQSRQKIHLGDFFNSNLTRITATINQDALIARFRVFRKIALMFYSPFLKASIISWISSTSFSVSFLCEVKAAINAGNDPLYESSMI